MDAFARDREASVPEEVRAAWDHVIAHWDDQAAHDALFSRTAEHQAYAWTAARYREASERQPSETAPYRQSVEGSPDALAHLERVRKAAEASLMVTATAHRANQRTPYVSSFLVLGVVAVMIFVGLVLAMHLRNREPENASRSTAPTFQVR
jgi:hypothetical protein